MSDSLEDAVAGANAGASSRGSEIVREKIIYPAAPAGLYSATCISAEEKEFKAWDSDDMELKYSLRFELFKNVKTGEIATYKGTDDKERRFSIWAKPMTRNFADGKKSGKPSNLYKLFREMFGIPPPTVKHDEMRSFGGGKPRLVEVTKFDHTLFVGAEVIIKVGVETKDDGTVKNTCEIDGFSCDADMKLHNWKQLPPQVRQAYPFPGAQTAIPSNPPAPSATASSAAESAAAAPAPSAPSSAPSAADPVTPAQAADIMGPGPSGDVMADRKAEIDEKAKTLPF